MNGVEYDIFLEQRNSDILYFTSYLVNLFDTLEDWDDCSDGYLRIEKEYIRVVNYLIFLEKTK